MCRIYIKRKNPQNLTKKHRLHKLKNPLHFLKRHIQYCKTSTLAPIYKNYTISKKLLVGYEEGNATNKMILNSYQGINHFTLAIWFNTTRY